MSQKKQFECGANKKKSGINLSKLPSSIPVDMALNDFRDLKLDDEDNLKKVERLGVFEKVDPKDLPEGVERPPAENAPEDFYLQKAYDLLEDMAGPKDPDTQYAWFYEKHGKHHDKHGLRRPAVSYKLTKSQKRKLEAQIPRVFGPTPEEYEAMRLAQEEMWKDDPWLKEFENIKAAVDNAVPLGSSAVNNSGSHRRPNAYPFYKK